MLQSGPKWDPKGDKSAHQKCKKVTLGNPGEPTATKMEPKGAKMEPKGAKIVPRHPKLRFWGSKTAPKICATIGTESKKLGHSVVCFKRFLINYIRQSTEPGARKTKKSGIPSCSLTLFCYRISGTVQQPGSAAQAVRPLQ